MCGLLEMGSGIRCFRCFWLALFSVGLGRFLGCGFACVRIISWTGDSVAKDLRHHFALLVCGSVSNLITLLALLWKTFSLFLAVIAS
jgi:hypothetical protein